MPKNTRRSAGEGSISRRADGRWQASLQIGERRRTVYGKTRCQVAEKLDGLKQQAKKAGNLPLPGKRTVGDLLDAWLETKIHTLKPRTIADYTDICDHYLRPTLGTTSLPRLTPDRIQRLYAGWQRQGKHRTALKAHQVLAPACALAVRWAWLGSSPCDHVDRPRYRAERKHLWTRDQLRTFLDGTREHWLHPVWVLAISTGARLGELLAFTWDDVDLATGTVRIDKATQRIGGKMVTTLPKTQSGARTLTLPVEAVKALRSQAERSLAKGSGQQVFRGYRGGTLAATTVEAALRRECARLGLPRVTPHGLRHLHASLLLAEGLPVPAVSQRLGHANSAITMAVYAHAIGKSDAEATAAIARAIGGTERIPSYRPSV